MPVETELVAIENPDGLNVILVIAGLLAFAGAVLALWLVREREIERDEPETVVVHEVRLEPAPA